jgi:hypothetical protein
MVWFIGLKMVLQEAKKMVLQDLKNTLILNVVTAYVLLEIFYVLLMNY